MADTFGTYAAKLDRFVKEMSDPAMAHAIGKMAKESTQEAVAADLGGDQFFSGWAPELKTAYDVIKGKPAISFRPASRRAAGPFTVAEIGRNQGNASGFSGPGLNRRTGVTSFTKSGRVRKQRAWAAKRWNGRTAGKGTATDAHKLIEKRLPKVVDKALSRAIRKSF
jgi:hypothetical protein